MIKVTNSYNQHIAISALGEEQRIKISNLQEQEISVKEIVEISNIRVANKNYNQSIKVRDVYSGSGQYEFYKGSYEVTPSVASKSLPTKNKIMEQNVEVKGIPYSKIPNNKGGNTISIG